MLKGSQITALALTLTSLFVGISTEIAYAKQSTEHTSQDPQERRCVPSLSNPCTVKGPGGNTPPSHIPPADTSTTDLKLNQELETVPAPKQTVDIVEDTEDSSDAKCTPKKGKPCPVIHPAGNTPASNGNEPTSTTDVKS